MRNTIYRIIYAVVLFCVTFVLLEVFSGGSSTQTTAQMSGAVLPVVSMDTGSTVFNTLYGRTDEPDPGKLRPVLTPVSSKRTVNVQVRLYGESLTAASVEVRDITGGRLIEQEDVSWQETDDGNASLSLGFKNLIEPDTEYLMVLILSTQDTENIRYYTRFSYSEDEAAQKQAEKAIAFAKTFHDKTFDKTADDYLLTYLEPDADKAGSDLSHVSLYSSADQVTWGNLAPAEVTSPVFSLVDEQNGIYGIRGSYYVSAEPDDASKEGQKLFRCEEYYELRMGTDRFYLMDFERTMAEDFDPQNPAGADGMLELGIADTDLPVSQSAKKSVTAFVHDGRLYEVSLSEQLLVYIYGFDNAKDTGERETNAAHDMRILDVGEDGSLDFLVYGYMNSGRHEGKTGISFYHYSGSYHTLEEKVFVPYDGSWELLSYRVNQVSYYDKEKGNLYLMLNDALYEIDVNSCSIRRTEENLSARKTVISENGDLAAMQEDTEEGGNIVLVNLETQSRTQITAPAGKKAVPLGFLGEDLVYGTVAESDIAEDLAGIVLEPMDHIYIVDPDQNVLEDYHRDGYYVVSCEMRQGQIVLGRVQKSADGTSYAAASDDEIMSGTEETETSLVRTKSSTRYGTIVQIQTGESDWSSCHYIRPQEILYEGSRELSVQDKTGSSGSGTDGQTKTVSYYVYSAYELIGCEYDLPTAIQKAGAARTGVVVDGKDRYIWRRNRPDRSEIDALTVMEEGTALQDSQEACLQAILDLENIQADVPGMLLEGMSSLEILQKELNGYEVLDLSGCSLDEVLYYVGEHQPVYAMAGENKVVLLVGYGPENVELYDPSAGSVHLMNLGTAKSLFEEAGNRFLSYIPAV